MFGGSVINIVKAIFDESATVIVHINSTTINNFQKFKKSLYADFDQHWASVCPQLREQCRALTYQDVPTILCMKGAVITWVLTWVFDGHPSKDRGL